MSIRAPKWPRSRLFLITRRLPATPQVPQSPKLMKRCPLLPSIRRWHLPMLVRQWNCPRRLVFVCLCRGRLGGLRVVSISATVGVMARKTNFVLRLQRWGGVTCSPATSLSITLEAGRSASNRRGVKSKLRESLMSVILIFRGRFKNGFARIQRSQLDCVARLSG